MERWGMVTRVVWVTTMAVAIGGVPTASSLPAQSAVPSETSSSETTIQAPETLSTLSEPVELLIPQVQSTVPKKQEPTVSPAAENISGAGMEQVTSVSQLSDVKPTDWAFQALQSLVERYGCIVGYLDKTYRGNRALTRYEFAAGVSACLDRMNELVSAATADLVKKEDLVTLQKLQEEFAAELVTSRTS